VLTRALSAELEQQAEGIFGADDGELVEDLALKVAWRQVGALMAEGDVHRSDR